MHGFKFLFKSGLWQLLSIRLMYLSFIFCLLITDFSFWIFLGVRHFCFFTFFLSAFKICFMWVFAKLIFSFTVNKIEKVILNCQNESLFLREPHRNEAVLVDPLVYMWDVTMTDGTLTPGAPLPGWMTTVQQVMGNCTLFSHRKLCTWLVTNLVTGAIHKSRNRWWLLCFYID